ncbi:hypothetical protein GJ496_010177 [Pomphorhynchus laevis]|nr:hypothetical protein GJ496_010177 [Pomphorhynchus laevis]
MIIEYFVSDTCSQRYPPQLTCFPQQVCFTTPCSYYLDRGKTNNDNDLSQSAVLLTLIAVVESFDNDALSEIHSTKSIDVLEFCDPLILAAWIPSCESSIFVTRRILCSLGTERMLDALCSLGSENRYDKLAISIMMNAVHCMSIPHSIRFKVNGLLQSHFNLKVFLKFILTQACDIYLFHSTVK